MDNGFTPRTFASPDGLTLYARDYGLQLNDTVPIVCLPGLTRNSRDFHQLALFLSRDAARPRRVLTLDYRGRGESDRDHNKANYNLLVEAQDVIAACEAFGIDRADFIGTSRGGLILHLLAAMRPALLRRIVLNDIGPRIETEGLKQIRNYLSRTHLSSDWPLAALALKAVHGPAFPILEDRDWIDMAQAIYAKRNGMIEADFDRAIVEQLQAADLDQPLPDLWAQFEQMTSMPLLIVRGENTALLSLETVSEMQRRHPNAILLSAGGQGHAPLLHVDGIAPVIADFLNASD